MDCDHPPLTPMSMRLIPMTKRLFSVVALLACASHAAEWEPLPPLPEPNGGFVCGHDRGQIIVVGGTNWEGGKKNWLDRRHSFDPKKMKWSTNPEVRVKVAYGLPMQSADSFSFMGGFDGSHERSIRNGVLAAGGGNVIVGGTNDPANVAGVSRETRTEGKGERRLADYPGKPFAVAAYAEAGKELFVFGGMTYDEHSKLPVNTDEAYAFDLAKNTWRPLKLLPHANRGMTAVTLDDQHIYLAGGYADDFTADAFIYDVKSDSYTKAKPLPYAAMVGLVKLDGFIYCLGGEDKKQSRTDKFFRIPVAELK